jgi:hypothetical protein
MRKKSSAKAPPWFMLVVMLFSYAVWTLSIASSSRFVRGGAHRVVKEAMGGTLTAQRLDSNRVICGLSNQLSADEQAKFTGDAGERLSEPRPRLTLEVCAPDEIIREYSLSPHTPRLRSQDLELMHKLWLNITSDPKFAGASARGVAA